MIINYSFSLCHPEHREGSDEMLSVAKNTSTNAFQILRPLPQNDTHERAG